MEVSGLGRWVSNVRFEFDPPLTLEPGAAPESITAFDLTPVTDVPGVLQEREAMLSDFVWRTLLGITKEG